MGKQSGKKMNHIGGKSGTPNLKNSKVSENSSKAYDEDTEIFISFSRELKNEGNRLFQKREYEGAMLKFEKAIKLLPTNHIDVSYLRSNMAACYMEMGLSEFPRAIDECKLALQVTPKYSKALLKRARCYEALNRPDFALRDVTAVLRMEPNNLMATEIAERVKMTIEKKGIKENDVPVDLIPVPEYFESHFDPPPKVLKEMVGKKKRNKLAERKVEDKTEEKKTEESFAGTSTKDIIHQSKAVDQSEKKAAEDNLVVEEQISITEGEPKRNIKLVFGEDIIYAQVPHSEDKLVVEEQSSITEGEPKRNIKLVFGEDIRYAQVPSDCSIVKLREIIADRFPSLKAVLVKYRDNEGDLVTITTDDELRLAEMSSEQHASVRLYIVEVNPEQDPFFEKVKGKNEMHKLDIKQNGITENGNVGKGKKGGNDPFCIDHWIIQFAQLFKDNVGVDSDVYLDLHEVGMKIYSEAIEETVTSEEAQELFNTAADTFQEMAALALFNWGNVHMSRARKRVYITEDASKESVLKKVKSSYEWAQKEYSKAGKRYEEALKIKPDFYEGILALAQKQFEQAKLSWYYTIGIKINLESWPSEEVLQLYNNAEDNMERGVLMWEEAEKQRLNELSKPSKVKNNLLKMGLDGLLKDLSSEEVAEQGSKMRSQINLLWATMLYERSIMEFKLGLPVWHESLEVAVEKFELAGVSPNDITVIIKNHCSSDNATEGLGFNIDEIVQAWREMYDVKRWQSGVPSLRLEPLLRRRVSELCHVLEHT